MSSPVSPHTISVGPTLNNKYVITVESHILMLVMPGPLRTDNDEKADNSPSTIILPERNGVYHILE